MKEKQLLGSVLKDEARREHLGELTTLLLKASNPVLTTGSPEGPFAIPPLQDELAQRLIAVSLNE